MSNPTYQEKYLGQLKASVPGFEGPAHVVEFPSNGSYGIGILALDRQYSGFFAVSDLSFRHGEVVHNSQPDPTPPELADGIEQRLEQCLTYERGGSSA